MAERIISAAIKAPDGWIFQEPPPVRHHHLIREMNRAGYKADEVTDQGFMAEAPGQPARFVDRYEALLIAKAAGQILEGRGHAGKLYSEDVW